NNPCTTGDACAADGTCVGGSPAPADVGCGQGFDPCTAVCNGAGTCTPVPQPPPACRWAKTCHSTCTRQLKACRDMCGQRGQARRECRTTCATHSSCAAPGAGIRTVAYVTTACTTDAQGLSSVRQRLFVRRGNCDPVPVVNMPQTPPIPDVLTPNMNCAGFLRRRWGGFSVRFGALQRLGVSPDASRVVFEVNDDFSSLQSVPPLPEEQKGFFLVRADGRGLVHLPGPPSRDKSFRGDSFGFAPPLSFSPDGRRVAFTDLGPGPSGEDAVQIVTLDLVKGARSTLTTLPSGTTPSPDFLLTCCPKFIDNDTVIFQTYVNPERKNAAHDFAAFTVRLDDHRLHRVGFPSAGLPGTSPFASFGVTGLKRTLIRLA